MLPVVFYVKDFVRGLQLCSMRYSCKFALVASLYMYAAAFCGFFFAYFYGWLLRAHVWLYTSKLSLFTNFCIVYTSCRHTIYLIHCTGWSQSPVCGQWSRLHWVSALPTEEWSRPQHDHQGIDTAVSSTLCMCALCANGLSNIRQTLQPLCMNYLHVSTHVYCICCVNHIYNYCM